jgi:hypothetical protein
MPEQLTEEFVDELEEAVNPVRMAAQTKALTSMRNMVHTREWAAMRTGITKRNPAQVYVVPQLRGGKRKGTQRQRDIFTERIQTRALDPALAENEEKVAERIDDLLDRIGRKEGF